MKQYSLYGLTFFDLGETATIGYLPVKCKKTGVLFYPRSWGDPDLHLAHDDGMIVDYDQFLDQVLNDERV